MVFYGSLLKEIMQLFASLGDVIMGALNKFMLGSDAFFSAMLDQDDVNLEPDSGSWLVKGIDEEPVVRLGENYMDEKSFLTDLSEYQIPNMLYSPENIFANNIAMLDINFLSPNTYIPIIETSDQEDQELADKMSQSAAGGDLQKTIADWYKSFRNISVVALLSILVYLGIRILISSTAVDKAKYKESITNWFVALCLVFVIHFIMSGILMITENFNALFSNNISEGILVEATPSNESSANSSEKIRFRTNLVGLSRFRAQADAWQDATAYTIVYLALVIYTCIFTFMYFKRFLYMAFFTMIAPLVALTYPIDKVGDGKAQAFNIWFKEYTMNAIIQPVHLILYTVFVSSAIDLATDNPIYALVAIAFLIPAEKFIKKMFGLDRAESTGGFGSFAGGALAMKGLQSIANFRGKKSGKTSLENGNENTEKDRKIRFNKTNSSAGNLNEFNQRRNIPLRDNNPQRESEERTRRLDSGSLQNEEGERALDSVNAEETERTRMLDNSNALYEDTSESQRVLNDTRSEWESIANDDGTSDLYREETENQINMLDGELVGRERPSNETDLGQSQIQNTHQPESKRDRRLKIAGAVGKVTGSNAWRAAKFAGRTLARTTGAVGGAAVGLAAGLTTGDMSKALSFAATGAVAGNTIGKNVTDVPERIYSGAKNIANNARSSIGSDMDKINVARYGYAEAKQRRDEKQNARSLKQMYKDKGEIAKARDLAGKLKGFTGDEKEIIRAKSDYYKAGITDDKLIEDAIKASYKESGSLSGQTHKEYVSMAAMINKGGLTGKDIRDEDSMKYLEERVQENVVDENVQKEVMIKMSDLLGERDIYERRSREGRTQIRVPIESQRIIENGRANNPRSHREN